MIEIIYGDNDEEFCHTEIDGALCAVWDEAPLDSETYTIWEGEIVVKCEDNGNGPECMRVVENIKERTFKQTKNLGSEYFDFDNFVEIKSAA